MNILGFNIGQNYKGILNLGSTINSPLSGTLQAVTDGMGNASPLQLSTTSIGFGDSTGLFWDNTNNRLGIGTNTPTHTLQVKTASTGDVDFINFTNGSNIQIARFKANGTFIFGTSSDFSIIPGSAALTRYGASIGFLSAPSARLHVRGDGTNPIARFENSSGSSAWAITATGSALTCESQARIQGPAIANDSSVVLGSFNNLTTTTLTQTILTTQGNIVCAAGSGNKRISSIEYGINNSGAQTGTATGIFLNATETALNGMTHNLMDLQVGGVSQFRISVTDATIYASNYNISASVYLGNSIAVSSSGGVKVGSSRIRSDADANLTLLNDAANNFSLLKFGGTTNAFPALKRNGAALEVRLADDSGLATLTTGLLNASQLLTAAVSASSGNNNGRVFIQSWDNTYVNVTNDGVGISKGTITVAHSSAMLEVASTTRGFLPPRMTEAQRLAIAGGTPAIGLMVYQTDASDGLYVYKAGGWTLII